ncbi:MAG TPA: hypothetical protein VN614_10515, partial [Rhodanobacter sp.]|nr:hypothetical protein [Rhodanobacter sp.]
MNALPDRLGTEAKPFRPSGDGRMLAERLSRRYAARIAGSIVIPATAGSYTPLPDDLPPALAAALRQRGVSLLYSHQAE